MLVRQVLHVKEGALGTIYPYKNPILTTVILNSVAMVKPGSSPIRVYILTEAVSYSGIIIFALTLQWASPIVLIKKV